MYRLWPSKKQYLRWSLPSKLTFISAYMGFFTLCASLGSVVLNFVSGLDPKSSIKFEERENLGIFNSEVWINDGNTEKLVYSSQHGVLSIDLIRDFDGDGFEDALISDWSGGNCCPVYYVIISPRGRGYAAIFTHADFWSWFDPEIIEIGGNPRFRIIQTEAGVGLNNPSESFLTFEFTGTSLKKIEHLGSEHRKEIPALASLTSHGVGPETPLEDLIINHDLNNDGSLEILECSYWERWGSLSCNVIDNGNRQSLNIGCHRIGITERIVEGYHALVCNADMLLYFDPDLGRYVEAHPRY